MKPYKLLILKHCILLSTYSQWCVLQIAMVAQEISLVLLFATHTQIFLQCSHKKGTKENPERPTYCQLQPNGQIT